MYNYVTIILSTSLHALQQGSSVLFDASQFTPLDPTQEPIFPPALRVSSYSISMTLFYNSHAGNHFIETE